MTKQLTDSEYQARLDAIDKFVDENNTVSMNIGQRKAFCAGFASALEYNQTKLNKLISMLIAAGVSEGIIKSVLQE